MPVFFHTISIWSQYLELYTTLNIKASYKKSSDDFFIELDFQKVIFSQRKHFTKIQKKWHAYITLLGSGVFILVEKPTGKA